MAVIDFSPMQQGIDQIETVQARIGREDVKETINAYYDFLLDVVRPMTDPQVCHEPRDEKAENGVGWNVAHLVLHVTASNEEGSTVASLLARGIVRDGRFRHERDWQEVTTTEAILQRIQESRRICLAYLDAWPDHPALDVYRWMPEGSRMSHLRINALGTIAFSLWHAFDHQQQIREAARQALAAHPV